MPHEPQKLLQDMLDAAGVIASFTENKSFDDYRSDIMLRSAVERQFEIIGEAVRRLRDLSPQLADRIPEYRRFIAFRNVIAHGYDALDDKLIWQAVKEKLTKLQDQALGILEELEGAP